MIGATFCSGIGAPEAACPEIDWRLASEIERFPRKVLSQRFDVVDASQSSARAAGKYLWGNLTALRVRHMRRLGIPFPNIIVAGTPCQAFSFAGRRESMRDARGNLTLEFVRMVHAIRKASRARGYAGPVLGGLVWENVPGVLSTSDNAFGCFLSALVGADAPLCTPDGERWPDQGMVAGPWARIAWRILDAQYFGLAQRRRRVFAHVSFSEWFDPAEILFERLGLHGNHPPRREAGQAATGTISARAEGGGGLGTDFELDGGLIAGSLTSHVKADRGSDVDKLIVTGGGIPEISHCLNAGGMGRQDFETETLIPTPMRRGGFFDGPTHTLKGEGFDASEDGTGRGVPLIPDHFPISFSAKDDGADAMTDLAPTLRAGGFSGSHANAGVMPAIAFQERGRSAGRSLEIGGDVSYALTSPNGGSRAQEKNIAVGHAVRRLMPVECERLQGFPDNHTLINMGVGRLAADGPRYKATGNSMAVPVLRWQLARIHAAWLRANA